jgi:hypothetical protein
MRRAVSPRQLPTATGTISRCQDKKTPIPPTRESMASTSTSCSPTFLFGAGNDNHKSHKFKVLIGSSPPPAVILPWPLPTSMPMQSVSPQYLLRCHQHGLLQLLLAPQATENGRIQLPYVRIPVLDILWMPTMGIWNSHIEDISAITYAFLAHTGVGINLPPLPISDTHVSYSSWTSSV